MKKLIIITDIFCLNYCLFVWPESCYCPLAVEDIEKKAFPLWLWEFPFVIIHKHCNKLEGGGRWILISCKTASSFGFIEVARGHICWGHWLSLADLMARVDPLAQKVKASFNGCCGWAAMPRHLGTSYRWECPCPSPWHQETRRGLCAVKLCSTNASLGFLHWWVTLVIWCKPTLFALRLPLNASGS